MLTAIEGKMEELFVVLVSLPPGKVEAAEKVNYSVDDWLFAHNPKIQWLCEPKCTVVVCTLRLCANN